MSSTATKTTSRRTRSTFRLRAVEPKESVIQNAILRYLKVAPQCSWARRMNTGAYETGEGRNRRYIRYGFPGCSDILGQMTDGRLLAIECKTRKGKATELQQSFLDTVNNNGGIGIIARSVDDVHRVIASNT